MPHRADRDLLGRPRLRPPATRATRAGRVRRVAPGLLVAAACYDGDLGEPPAGAEDRPERVVNPSIEENQCDSFERSHAPPLALVDASEVDCDPIEEPYCLRLQAEFREVAAARDPRRGLQLASRELQRFAETQRRAHQLRGWAFADLTVSGRRSFEAFTRVDPSVTSIGGPATPRYRRQALARAHRTAWALRGPAATRAELRPTLGYVAVSPEDDPPDRPVNIESGRFPQTDLELEVPTDSGEQLRIRTRVLVASTEPTADVAAPRDVEAELPETPSLRLPETGPIVLFVHGHASLAEEGAALFPELVAQARHRGSALTVVAMDLPSNAYASRVDPARVGRGDEAALRFLDRFLVTFVDRLEAEQPGTKDRIHAVIGGSLGGNLVLRLAQRTDLPWVQNAVVWSPASVDFSWSRAKLLFAEPGDEFVDVVKHEAVRMTRDASEEPEEVDSRKNYFVGGLMSVRKQADYWYRSDWRPCRSRMVEEGLRQLGEVYDDRFRRWHYRLAYEQLVFSHLERAPGEDRRRFEKIEIPLLVLTGEEDDGVPMSTYTFIERLAPYLTMPGETLFLRRTGHAMHSERPRLLAAEILRFLQRRIPPFERGSAR